MSKLFPDNDPVVWMPIDDSLISGPNYGLVDIPKTLQSAVSVGVDSIIGFYGSLSRNWHILRETPLILNLTASTFRIRHTEKYVVGCVEDAIGLDADGIAAHVNISAPSEPEMLHQLASIRSASRRHNFPLLAMMYLRGESQGKDENYISLAESDPKAYASKVAHAVRIGVELGADAIKTQFFANPEYLDSVIHAASGVPVVISGGELIASEDEVLSRATALIRNGASGLCYGRNIYNRDNPGSMVKLLKKAISSGKECINE